MREILIYDGYNHNVIKGDIIGTVVPNYSRWGLTNGYKIIEIRYEQNKDTRLHLEEQDEWSGL